MWYHSFNSFIVLAKRRKPTKYSEYKIMFVNVKRHVALCLKMFCFVDCYFLKVDVHCQSDRLVYGTSFRKIIPDNSRIRVIKNIFQEGYAVLFTCQLDPRNQVIVTDHISWSISCLTFFCQGWIIWLLPEGSITPFKSSDGFYAL